MRPKGKCGESAVFASEASENIPHFPVTLNQKTTTICTVAYFPPPLYCLLRASEIPWRRSKPYTQQTHLVPGIVFLSDGEKQDRLFLFVKAITYSWHLASTLPCNPCPSGKCHKEKQCWPWETGGGFEGVFLKAWVCNWVEQQAAGFDGVRGRVGTHRQKEGKQEIHTNKNTHRESPDFNKTHTWSAAAGPVEPTARRFGRLWVLTQQPFGTSQASHHPDRSEWAQFFFFLQEAPPVLSAARSKSPALMGVQLDQQNSHPRTSLVQFWLKSHWSVGLETFMAGPSSSSKRALFSHPPALCYAIFLGTCHVLFYNFSLIQMLNRFERTHYTLLFKEFSNGKISTKTYRS